MKSKYKIIFLCSLVFLLTGCTTTYNVEIYKEKVKINGKIIEKDKSKWNEVVSVADPSLTGEMPEEYEGLVEKEKSEITYAELIDLKTSKKDEASPKLEGLSKLKNPWQLGLKYKNSFKLFGNDIDSFIKAAGPTYCYDNFNITTNEEDKTVIISTSLNNNCFKNYPNLEKIQVNVKTNHKVVSSTADIEKKDSYTWNINSENAENRAIQIIFKKDEYVWNYDNWLLKAAMIIIILVPIGFAAYKLTKLKD